MKLIADFHIHSQYAYATSKDMKVAGIYHWSKLKGITVIGTGDCTHPTWVRELEQKLEPVAGGLWQVKDSLREKFDHYCLSVAGFKIYFLYQPLKSVLYIVAVAVFEKFIK